MGILLFKLDNDAVNESCLIDSDGACIAIVRDTDAEGKLDITEV